MAKYWFKSKAYGYGAAPASWEGWVVTAVFVALIVATRLLARTLIHDRGTAELVSWGAFVLLIGALVWLCTVKGDRVWRWRWGKD